MKKFLFFGFLALLLCAGGRAFAQGSSVTIIADHGEKFSLEVNGSMQNSTPEDRVTAYNLFGPSFKVKVYIEGANVAPVAKSVFNKPNYEFFFALRKNTKGIYVLETVSRDYQPAGAPEGAAAATPPPTEKKETKEAPADATKEAAGKSGCTDPLTTEEFAPFYAQVSARPFEGTQVSAIKNLVVDKCLTTLQLKELLYILDLENSRLDCAKYAYVHIYDPDNYGDLDDVFHSNSSVESLHKYVNSKK